MNRIIVFKWNVSWSFPLPAPSGCTGNGGTESNISKKPHGHSPGAPGVRWASMPLCLCAAPLSHKSNPHNPSLCPCMGHEGPLLCFSLTMVARGWYTLSHHPHPLQNTGILLLPLREQDLLFLLLGSSLSFCLQQLLLWNNYNSLV